MGSLRRAAGGSRRTAGTRLWGLGFRNRNRILFDHETADFVHKNQPTDNCPHFRDGSTLPIVYTSSIVVYYRLWACPWGPKAIYRYLTGPMTVRRVDILTAAAVRRAAGGTRRPAVDLEACTWAVAFFTRADMVLHLLACASILPHAMTCFYMR